MKSCIDLQKMFGLEYRVDRDPAYFAEYGANARTCDPWYWRIVCKHGHIYPHGGEALGASTNRRGAIANRLASIPGLRVAQDADDGINVVFPIELFAAVAEIMKPRKRRRLSPAHRAALVDSGTKALAEYRSTHSDLKASPGQLVASLDFQVAC